MNDQYEEITVPPTLDGDEYHLATVVRAGFQLEAPGIRFLTDQAQSLQLAVMQFPTGHVVPAHRHLSNRRTVDQTQETLIVRTGKVAVSFYRSGGEFVAVRVLHPGDVVHLLTGGHRVEALVPSSIMEVKTGPYYGRDKDKVLLEVK